MQSAQCSEYAVELRHEESVGHPRLAAKKSVMAICCSIDDLHVTSQLIAQYRHQQGPAAGLRRWCRMRAERYNHERADHIVNCRTVSDGKVCNSGHALGNLSRPLAANECKDEVNATVFECLSLDAIS